MSSKVLVTGLGIISSIGSNVDEVYASLTEGRDGIRKIKHLNTRYRGELLAGEVPFSNDELIELSGFDLTPETSRSILLGLIAAKEALKDAGIKDMSQLRTGLISATSVGGMDKSEFFLEKFFKDNTKGRLRNVAGHDCGYSSMMIAKALGIKDFVSTVSTACSSSANSIMFGARLIKNGVLDRVVVGGTDALTKFTLNGFNTLNILDHQKTQPFDASRRGLNLGEGAAYLVIESEEIALHNGKNVYCELAGYGNTNDAYHQTASSPDGKGAFAAMNKALKTSQLSPDQIDYINAHGTGTPNNDLSEGLAIMRLFKEKIPACSSTKAFTGHTLGAAGSIEAVISALAIHHQVIFPNLNFENKIEALSFKPVVKLARNQKVNKVLSNSFGFGGSNSTLIFSKL